MNSKTEIGISGAILTNEANTLKSWNKLHYGMFIHLGLYSLLGGRWKGEAVTDGYSEQIQMWANIPSSEYESLMEEFSLENFDAEEIVSLARNSGMKYLVVTSKHHDGFCLFNTKTTTYNVVESTPFGKDIIKLLAEECEKQGLKFGLYYSLVDWHAGHEYDLNNNNKIPYSIEELIKEQLTELMTKYGEIVEVWFDMSHPTLEQSVKFADIVRTYQPNAAINGRIWNNEGDFRTLGDNQIPTTALEGMWQTPASIYNETWSYREWQARGDVGDKARELLKHLISIRARGGNYLLNIGPKGDGSLVSFEVEVLSRIGKWLKRHPEAVIGSSPTKFEKQPWGEITYSNNNLYLHLYSIPENKTLTLKGLLSSVKKIVEDGTDQPLKWQHQNNELEIQLPGQFNDSFLPTLKIELMEELFVLPNNLIEKEHAQWVISAEKIEKSYNFVDEGYYNSLESSNVKQSTYLVNETTHEVSIEIDGQANPAFDYLLTVGNQKQVISGKEIMEEQAINFLIKGANRPTSLVIELYEPENRYQDLELDINKIIIKILA